MSGLGSTPGPLSLQATGISQYVTDNKLFDDGRYPEIEL